MAGSVYQVENVLLPDYSYVLSFYGNAAFAFNVHRIEELIAHQSGIHRSGKFKYPVGERRFAMIYMADDREVSYPRRLYHDVTGTSLPEREMAGGRAVGGEEVGMPVGGAVTAAGQRLAAKWVVAWRQSGRWLTAEQRLVANKYLTAEQVRR